VKRKRWQDKVSERCIEGLEYHRREKAFYHSVPADLADLYRFSISGGFIQFTKDTGHLLNAKPEDYEEVELGQELTEFLNNISIKPWGPLTPGVIRIAPNGARIIREFQQLVLLFEKNPTLRAVFYLITPIFGGFARDKIEEMARKLDLPDFAAIAVAFQNGDLHPLSKATGKILENVGRALQGKSLPKGKLDHEKIGFIDFIRQNQKEKLSWKEMRDALEFGGIHFDDAETLRVFAHRVRNRKTVMRRNSRKSAGK